MRFIRRLFWSKDAIEFIMFDKVKGKKGKVLSIQTKGGKLTNYTVFKGKWRFKGKFLNDRQKAAIAGAKKILGKKKLWRRP